ncbi:LAETG motif-containing sortase-dependent surface protein [Streptomyces sp. NPDC101175]|uniref:LAETG motif-containing sortase-dependent surface protein n=1 Tax=Streptomyces sp. NPDC101175 TaxID=3366123 RepID=UPI003835ACB8
MKLRRVMATIAATAAIAPLALLSAPAAFAEDGAPDTSSSSPAAEESSPAADASSPAADESSPAADTSSPAADTSSPAADTSSPAASTSSPAASGTPSGSASASPSASPSKPSDFDPYEDCTSFDLDEKLTASLTGLPNKIVAGSGWHNFKFVVKNASDKDLQNVWINALTEYSDDVNDDASLLLDLADIQLKQDGKWTDSYQQTVGSGHDKITLSGSVVAVLPTLEKHSSTTLDLRVKIKSTAPAGSSFALSQAVYAGQDDDCYVNGDYYEFSVLAAGSGKPGDVGEAKPTGQKPSGTDEDLKPQGSVNEATGNLAETGSSSALPVIGLVGGAAVVAGAAAVVMVRRRKTGESA